MRRRLSVSIRTRHFCRVMPFDPDLLGVLTPVSIRTRHFCRVMRCVLLHDHLHFGFQSAPGISAG